MVQHKVKTGLRVHTQVKHENALQKLKFILKDRICFMVNIKINIKCILNDVSNTPPRYIWDRSKTIKIQSFTPQCGRNTIVITSHYRLIDCHTVIRKGMS